MAFLSQIISDRCHYSLSGSENLQKALTEHCQSDLLLNFFVWDLILQMLTESSFLSEK